MVTMDRKFRLFTLVLAVLLMLSVQSAFAQQRGSEYFPETGHNLTGDFYAFYTANPNARLVYGLPVTEAFIDPNTGRLIQYFEKARFEYFAENMTGDKVRLTPVGKSLYEHGTYVTGLTESTPNCYQQDNWDYPVCFSFHTFYERYGGESQFGRPVSGMEYLRGRLVQFFEYAQLQWWPENQPDSQIIVANTGLKYFYANETNPDLLYPITNFSYYSNISEIQVSAFPKWAVISNGSDQEIGVIARDQNNAPLANAFIYVTLRFPDGSETEIKQLTTDNNGLTNFTISNADSDELGTVEVLVRLTYNNLETITVTSFRIWY